MDILHSMLELKKRISEKDIETVIDNFKSANYQNINDQVIELGRNVFEIDPKDYDERVKVYITFICELAIKIPEFQEQLITNTESYLSREEIIFNIADIMHRYIDFRRKKIFKNATDEYLELYREW